MFLGFESIFFILFFLVFFLVFGIILFTVIKGLTQWNKNNHSPRLSVVATVVAKRTSVSHSHHHTGEMMHTTAHTTYYATFQVESGDRMELYIPSDEFGMLAEGDVGTLSFQGTRYLSFVRR